MTEARDAATSAVAAKQLAEQQQAAVVEAARREGKQLGEAEAAQAHASALAASEEAAQRAHAVATDNLQQQLAAAQQVAEAYKEKFHRADGACQALQASASRCSVWRLVGHLASENAWGAHACCPVRPASSLGGSHARSATNPAHGTLAPRRTSWASTQLPLDSSSNNCGRCGSNNSQRSCGRYLSSSSSSSSSSSNSKNSSRGIVGSGSRRRRRCRQRAGSCNSNNQCLRSNSCSTSHSANSRRQWELPP